MSNSNGSGDAEVVPVVGEEIKLTESDKSTEQISQLESQIIRQIEYYFGDINLPKDKFLREQVKLDDGWVPLSVLLTFKRLANMTTDVELIANALDKSEKKLVTVSEDRLKVRRTSDSEIPEFTEERRKELMKRTAYVKGFPLENTTLDQLLEFMKNYNTVENVVMRSYFDKPAKKHLFKGSIFATFSTVEQCEEFLKLEKLEYEGKELIYKWQEKYLEEKRIKNPRRAKNNKTEEGEEVKEENRLPKGAVLHVDGFSDSTTREDIKETIGKLGACEIAYVDFTKGDKSGWVRLQGTDTAKAVFDACPDGKLSICDTEVTVRVLEGEEETKFLDKVLDDMKKRRQTSQGKGRNSRGGKGGRPNWNNRKRKGSPVKGPASKH